MNNKLLQTVLKKFKNEIYSIYNSTESDEIILDSFEIDINCLNFIRIKKIDYFDIFFELAKIKIENNNFDDFISNELAKNYLSCESFKSFQKYILDYFDLNTGKYLDNVFNNIDELLENEILEDEIFEDDAILDKKLNSDNNESDEESQYINITLDEAIKINNLRKNQLDALDKAKKDNWASGINNQCTGAGKTIIMMSNINNHYNLNKKNNIGKI